MCWQAAVRGALIARKAAGLDRPDWLELAGNIRRDIVEHGWSDRAGAYTAFYGSDEIDAASLWVVLGGLLPPDDPRAVSTVRAVQRALQEGPTVFRYRNSDGLPGVEGGFHICAFWLVEALWMIGARSEASDLFARITETIPPTGLLSEQYDPRTGVALGNFPQAYSHLGLINAAVRLSG